MLYMVQESFLDNEIDLVTRWIFVAGKSLRGFYNKNRGVFWRKSTLVGEDTGKKQPTSTNRSFIALYEYLQFLYEDNVLDADIIEDNIPEAKKEVTNILQGVFEKYLALLQCEDVTSKDIKIQENSIRWSYANGINMFTDSHLLFSISLLEELQRIEVIDVETNSIEEIMSKAELIADENIKNLKAWKGGKIKSEDEIHDFVTVSMIRGLDAFYRDKTHLSPLEKESNAGDSFPQRVKRYILEQLAYHFSKISSRFDPPELAFSVSLLNRFPTPDAPQLIERAVRSIVESQSEDGAWPTSRYVSYEGKGMLHVSSFEVALTLVNLLICKIDEVDEELIKIILPSLEKAFGHIRSDYTRVDNLTGWANDHARRTGLIESWVTALILTFLIHYRHSLLQLRQQIILKRYETDIIKPSVPKDLTIPIAWLDMVPLFPQLKQIDERALNDISDPTEDNLLVSNLKQEIINPIINNWIHRPHRRSIILQGPPGTRKTGLVIRLAKSLQWPLLILSPPHFLQENGLDGFESTAARIFEDLFRLRRVIILFDECEEFFKKRPSQEEQKPESRTIGAFITAGMLPRLQRLSDKKWVSFILATNSKLEELDPAVTRRGRFDFTLYLEFPKLNALIHYLRKKSRKLGNEKIIHLETELRRIFVEEEELSSQISFSHLDELLNKIFEDTDELNRVQKILKDLIQQKYPPSLI